MIRNHIIELSSSYVLLYENSKNPTVDVHYVACAILAESDYFLTTDDRLLKYRTNELHIIDPVGFIREVEADGYDDNE